MMNSPILSIIVPIYNAESTLKECIDSILNQTFKNMEIILINDGSTDDSLKICEEYEKKYDYVHLISQENKGLISARKAGVKHAVGEIVGFVDSDDWIEKEMYEDLVDSYLKSSCDIVSSGTIRDYTDTGKSFTIFDHYEPGLYQDLERTIYPTMLYNDEVQDMGLYCTLCNKIFRKKLLNSVYEDINEEVFYGEDALALYSCCLLAKSIYIQHQAFYHYNIRTGTMCFRIDERLPHNNYLLYLGLKESFEKSDISLVLMRQLKKYVLDLEAHNLQILYDINLKSLGSWEFLCSESLFEHRFVIYGAGICGQELYQKVCNIKKEQNIAAWIDKNADKICVGYSVQKPAALLESKWEYIIIAVQDGEVAEQIADELQKIFSIDRSKIVWGKPKFKSMSERWFLQNSVCK